jgi:hypothetical protein
VWASLIRLVRIAELSGGPDVAELEQGIEEVDRVLKAVE